MNYDLEAARLEEGLGGKSALEGHQARLHGGRRRAAARLGPHRAHARAPRRGEAVEAHQRRAVRQHAGRADRQPGAAAGEGRPEGDLPVRAGRSPPTRTSPARCIRTSRSIRSTRCRSSCERINNTFVRADQIQHMEGKGDIDFFAPIVADAEAGFGGVLNAFELMKAMIEAGAAGVHFEDQLAVGEEVRPHGRQGARADARSGREADRRAARRRLHGRADDRARAHRRRSGRPRHVRHRRQRQAVPAPASARSRASTRRATASTRRCRAASPTRRTRT